MENEEYPAGVDNTVATPADEAAAETSEETDEDAGGHDVTENA